MFRIRIGGLHSNMFTAHAFAGANGASISPELLERVSPPWDWFCEWRKSRSVPLFVLPR